MDRCHLYLPLVDSSGAAYPYAEVTLLDSISGTPITEPVYLDPNGGAPQEWPILVNPAVIDLWTDVPLRVIVQALLPSGATFTRSGVDISPAPAATVRTEQPVHISSAKGLSSEALLAISPDGTAAWQVLDALKFHKHEGNAPESTVLGTLTPNDIYPGQTFISASTLGAQGEGATSIGRDASPGGAGDVTVGRSSSAAGGAVAAGAASEAGESSVAIGVRAKASTSEQVALGRDVNAAAAVEGAVVVGAQTTAAANTTIALKSSVRGTNDTSMIIGQGTLPDLSWLGSNPYIAVLGNAVFPNFFTPRQDVVLAGASSVLGVFGVAGTTQPIVSTSSLAADAPGRAAILSLVSALDQLGLIYLTDGAIDDELADWTKSLSHDSNLILETGDSDGSKAGDLNRARRSAAGTGRVTYQRVAGLRDFRVRVFAWQQSGPNPVALASEVVAEVSPDNVTWTSVPLDLQTMTATAASWYQTWAANARPLPSGMQYLRLTLQTNTTASTPQIGRVIVR